ncbi:MAG: GNAT family N-acetyltransferase [Oscillospiraceae bacterium]|nr:GNAT family N-acetyltransferase [Oscillospiraceae bacterium]
MIIETERLILRPWEDTDAESCFCYAKNPNVGPMCGWPPHESVEGSLYTIRNVLSEDETYAVCLKEDNRAIGSISLIPTSKSHTNSVLMNELEIGYWIGEPFWGRGLIPEAAVALIRHAIKDCGCTGMWCGYFDGNEKSARCAEKLGFSYHHTEPDKPCPLLGKTVTEHYTYLPAEKFISLFGE